MSPFHFQSPRARVVAWIVFTTCCAALVLSFVGLIAAIRQTQLENTPTGDKLLAASDRIIDCTEPTGDCYKDGQRRTAQAVGNINRVIVLAAACSVGLDPALDVAERQTEIQSCVIERLSAKP